VSVALCCLVTASKSVIKTKMELSGNLRSRFVNYSSSVVFSALAMLMLVGCELAALYSKGIWCCANTCSSYSRSFL